VSRAAAGPAVSAEKLDEIVAAADLGARRLGGAAGAAVFWIAVAWSLFQLWYASPLPFVLGVWILNDTEARSIHLAFAIFLVFVSYPALTRSPRDRVPLLDWVLAALGALAGGYLFLAYRELALRPGLPSAVDLAAAGIGVALVLEATRRSLGPWLAAIAALFLVYCLAGPWMPEAMSHKGVTLSRLASHMWLTTEGVFGVALGVSTTFIFLYVLFGALLEKAGGGNWMMQVSFALLGHLKGGPAKVAVVSSGLNGVISGSSVSNVVTGGIFTIPMMKRTGLSGVKAGAIETASSINGQIMPPVMGAAAFLMVEYVGIPYVDIVKHAALPAIVSYVALFYIVHLEALKLGAQGLPRRVRRGPAERAFRVATGVVATILLSLAVYYGIGWIRVAIPEGAGLVLGLCFIAAYLACLGYAARFPDLALDDPSQPMESIPDIWPVVRTGLHFLLPIVVLLWCMMVEQMSPGLAAFWASAAMILIMLTQRPVLALFRRERVLGAAAARGVREVLDGLAFGARNMAGIAVACGVAGIIVGTVTLTGVGLMLTEAVELVAGDNVLLMLVLTAAICLVLGLGVPTTASYIVIATLIAPVIVELGAQGGLAIPLIAVHLFVFYFGIMADATPPVGLAAFAAAAISGDDPTKVGLQALVYSLRTGILPFVFIYNPQLLLIGIEGWGHGILVIAGATLAILLFAAVTMRHLFAPLRIWEMALLAVAIFMLLRPGWWMDRLYAPHVETPPARLFELARTAPADAYVDFVIEGEDLDGETRRKAVTLRLPAGATPEARLAATGAIVGRFGPEPVIGSVRLRSPAERAGLEQGWRVVATREPTERPSRYLWYLPALLLVLVVALPQLARRRRARAGA
jgi:TRAP transporter 4TM/12TM fusion protein